MRHTAHIATKIKTSKIIIHEINQFKSEVSRLKSAMISFIARDEEGEYRPNFIESILRIAGEKPTHSFQDAKSFLADLEKYN